MNSLRDVIDSNITEQIYITPDIIRICIGRLKAGKDDGDIGFKSDHIIDGTHRLYVLLSLLYNFMFYHGHSPAYLLKSTIVSIPKDNKASLSGSDNYRGISLLNSHSKLFDHIILLKYSKQLQSSDIQFGYKGGHLTTLCTLIYKEVIDHYINNDSTVYSCFLDASKAFDRVRYDKLFSILLSKHIPKIVVRLYVDSYMIQKACVSWDNIKTSYFSMSNGVNKVGLFRHFFSLYIDPLLLELKRSGFGCHINGTYMGVLSYADDITLSCPSIWGLNDMLKFCERFLVENSILFNKKKTMCIKFGSKVKEGERDILDSSNILGTDNVVHLACNDDVDCNI